MKKAGLQDVKRENRRLLMTTILENQPVSRIELSEHLGLSPSTVTSLVGELLEQGWITETGMAASTGGRKRTELQINKEKGYLVILEVGWRRTFLHFLDMNLEQTNSIQLSDYYITGNELLEKAKAFLTEEAGNFCPGTLAGIGLLFQEDMRPSDFHVMYSTSLSSDIISLTEALRTQFKVPILEEYSQTYSFKELLKREEATAGANSAHIEIGKKIFISITTNGTALEMSEGKKADMTPYIAGMQEGEGEGGDRLTEGLVRILAMVCMLFPVNTVYLSGRAGADEMARSLAGRLKKEGVFRQPVTVKSAHPVSIPIHTEFGKSILQRIILEM